MEKGPNGRSHLPTGSQPAAAALREQGQRGRAEPSAADPVRGGPSRTHCASSDGTSLFAAAPASYDTHFKKRRKMSPVSARMSPRSRSSGGAPVQRE